jgi:hypothetical protein
MPAAQAPSACATFERLWPGLLLFLLSIPVALTTRLGGDIRLSLRPHRPEQA